MTLSTLEEQRRIAETLDVNLFLNNVLKIELELAVTRMTQNWQQLSSQLNNVKQRTENASVKWEQFRKLAFELLDAMENINKLLHRFTPSIDDSSIGKIKEQFDHVIVSFHIFEIFHDLTTPKTSGNCASLYLSEYH